jgi:hypothetical protein
VITINRSLEAPLLTRAHTKNAVEAVTTLNIKETRITKIRDQIASFLSSDLEMLTDSLHRDPLARLVVAVEQMTREVTKDAVVGRPGTIFVSEIREMDNS